jgi:hypothetical protein
MEQEEKGMVIVGNRKRKKGLVRKEQKGKGTVVK